MLNISKILEFKLNLIIEVKKIFALSLYLSIDSPLKHNFPFGYDEWEILLIFKVYFYCIFKKISPKTITFLSNNYMI